MEKNETLKAKINEIRQKQDNNEVMVKVNERNVTDIKKEYSQWKNEREKVEVNFKEIM